MIIDVGYVFPILAVMIGTSVILIVAGSWIVWRTNTKERNEMTKTYRRPILYSRSRDWRLGLRAWWYRRRR